MNKPKFTDGELYFIFLKIKEILEQTDHDYALEIYKKLDDYFTEQINQCEFANTVEGNQLGKWEG